MIPLDVLEQLARAWDERAAGIEAAIGAAARCRMDTLTARGARSAATYRTAARDLRMLLRAERAS